jgi:hypothetical protein
MPVYERINVTVSLSLVGLALYFVLDFPAEQISFTLFNSPVGFTSLWRWLMTLLLAGLVMAGTDAVLTLKPVLASRRLSYRATFWALPGLLIIFAAQTLGLAPGAIAWAIALIIIGGLLWLTLLAQYQQSTPNPAAWSEWWQQIIGYGLVLGLFILIYYARNRSILSASAVLLVSMMIALPLLRLKSVDSLSQIWLLATVIGAGMAQITWVLNYWRITSIQAGLLLLLIFYTLVGLTQQYLLTTLNRRAIWEFGIVAVVVIGLIFYF